MLFACRRLTQRPDFRNNPAFAILKRMVWRARWTFKQSPWNLPLDDGSRILVPHSGAGALTFFQKSSDPSTAAFLKAFLQPGMVFVDAGAHIGEFTLRAARFVGIHGEVHAFEPSPGSYALLQQNAALNAAANVRAIRAALSDSTGTLALRIEDDPSLNRLDLVSDPDPVPRVPVDSLRLDDYWAAQPRRPIDLIKMDVEGAELLVLLGAVHIPGKPVWFFEYSPENYRCFGYEPGEIISVFHERGYELWTWENSACRPLTTSLGDADRNLIAAPAGRHPLDR